MKALTFIRHISKMASSGGNRRFAFAFANALIVGLAILFFFLCKYCFGIMESNFAGGLLGGILCVALSIFCGLHGIIAQIALVFISLIGIFGKEQRAGNFCAFLVSLASLIAGAVAVYFIFLN